MLTVFFAYSHRDEELRNELEIHLAMLKREKIIGTWHDRRIGAGKEIHGEIDKFLEEADIILLLVSPYFLASDYCYDIEMDRAMKRHTAGSARVIPVILHPCDWQKAPFGKLNAVPKDGRPISKFPNQHDASLEVVQTIRGVAEEMNAKKGAPPQMPEFTQQESHPDIKGSRGPNTSHPRSSNLRIKKQFSDQEKDRFLNETFEYIANFFESSLSELKERNPGTEVEFRRVDANHFRSKVYLDGDTVARCKIWMGGGGGFGDGIFYSQSDSSDSSFNESLSVDDDGYTLFLKPLGLASLPRDKTDKMTQNGASEFLWSLFIERLQR